MGNKRVSVEDHHFVTSLHHPEQPEGQQENEHNRPDPPAYERERVCPHQGKAGSDELEILNLHSPAEEEAGGEYAGRPHREGEQAFLTPQGQQDSPDNECPEQAGVGVEILPRDERLGDRGGHRAHLEADNQLPKVRHKREASEGRDGHGEESGQGPESFSVIHHPKDEEEQAHGHEGENAGEAGEGQQDTGAPRTLLEILPKAPCDEHGGQRTQGHSAEIIAKKHRRAEQEGDRPDGGPSIAKKGLPEAVDYEQNGEIEHKEHHLHTHRRKPHPGEQPPDKEQQGRVNEGEVLVGDEPLADQLGDVEVVAVVLIHRHEGAQAVYLEHEHHDGQRQHDAEAAILEDVARI